MYNKYQYINLIRILLAFFYIRDLNGKKYKKKSKKISIENKKN